jgi:hypothetical protein
VGDDVPVDSDVLLMTDFVNLNIKPAQSFECAHRGRVYMRVFIGVSAHSCMSICICTVFLKKYQSHQFSLSQSVPSFQLSHSRLNYFRIHFVNNEFE